jgi:hypothetical protein
MIGVEADTRQLLEFMHANNNQEVFLNVFSGTPDAVHNAQPGARVGISFP